MASAYRDPSRPGAWRVQLYTHLNKRVVFWLGKCTQTQALSVASKLERLKIARGLAEPPDADLLQWIAAVSPRLRARLVDACLIDDDRRDIPRTLDAFVEWYISSRTDNKPRTNANLRAAKRHLVDALGADRQLSAVTAGDAERIARTLYGSAADSHAGKLIGRFRQFFAAAIDDRLITDNPFANVRVATNVDTDRQCYVDAATVDRLIAAAPNQLWRAILAFARYGGLRVPSEILSLQWSDFDFEHGRFTIRSEKTKRYASGVRVCPMFPKLRTEIDALFDAAPDGATWVCDRYRHGAGAPFRDQLISICARAGVEPWPKLWVNLRASCRTDLERIHPEHVCDSWLGHSAAVAKKHYLRVTDADFDRALQPPNIPEVPNTSNEETPE